MPISAKELLPHTAFVAALARRLVLDAHQAEDLAQQTFLAALEKPPKNNRPLRAWLTRVARNLSIKNRLHDIRRQRRETVATDKDRVPTPEVIVQREELRKTILQAVLDLNEPIRDTLLLRYYENMPPRHVAQHLGIPVETVKTRLKRGLHQLRSVLDSRYKGGIKTWLPIAVPVAGLSLSVTGQAASASLLGALIMSANTKLGITVSVVLILTLIFSSIILVDELPVEKMSLQQVDALLLEPEVLEKPASVVEEVKNEGRELPSENLESSEQIVKRNLAANQKSRRISARVELYSKYEKSPIGMRQIPKGTVQVGLDEKEAIKLCEDQVGILSILSRSIPEHRAEVKAFYCDHYEVTNLQYKQYLNQKGVLPSKALSQKCWDYNQMVPYGEEDLPVRNVTFFEAQAFARWCGKRIPSEVEWLRAASGRQKRTYSWGNRWDDGRHCTNPDNTLLPVGSYSSNRSYYRIYDLTGSVWEWTSSPFEAYPDWNPPSMIINRKTVQASVEFNAKNHVIKGGHYRLGDLLNRLDIREVASPDSNHDNLGFRCVRDNEPGGTLLGYMLKDHKEQKVTQHDFVEKDRFLIENRVCDPVRKELTLQYDHFLLWVKDKGWDLNQRVVQSPIRIGVFSISRPLKEPCIPAGSYVLSFTWNRADQHSLPKIHFIDGDGQMAATLWADAVFEGRDKYRGRVFLLSEDKRTGIEIPLFYEKHDRYSWQYAFFTFNFDWFPY